MIRKITLDNFMSHGKTVIELADGLTVLTGPNNCGKSALVSALQILAANGRTTHVMRHGSKVCRITVETDDDQTIVWERKKSTVKYIINGEDVHRIGQGVPENLHDSLRLDKVTTESGTTKNEYDIHFGEQKSPVFLLNESGSRAAAFFASSSDAARLVEMQHVHRTRTTRARSEAKRLNSENEQNIARLAAFAPIDAISESVNVAEKRKAKIDAQQLQGQAIGAIIENLQKLKLQVTRWRSELEILVSLDQAQTTPDKLLAGVAQCKRLRAWLNSADIQTRKRDFELSRFHTLSRLLPLPVQQPAAILQALIDRIEETQCQRDVAKRISTSCALLAGPPAMQPAEACRQISEKLVVAIQNKAAAELAHKALAGLIPPPQVIDTRGIAKQIKHLNTAIKTHVAMKSRLSATEKLAAPPAIALTQPLEQMIARLSKDKQRCETIAGRVRKLEALRTVETPSDPQPLKSIIDRLKRSVADVARAVAKADDANQMAIEHEQLVREFVSANPKCETCGGSIDAETLMSTMPGTHNHFDDELTPESLQ